MSEKRCDYCEQDPPDLQRAPCPFCGFKSAAVRGRETDEIEILRHQVAVLQRNLDRARGDHDKERQIVLDRLRAAHEAVEAMRPLTVAKSHTVDVYDRARDALDAYSRAPYVPESWYARREPQDLEGSFIGHWPGDESDEVIAKALKEIE